MNKANLLIVVTVGVITVIFGCESQEMARTGTV
jgi:hypothetical protein